MVRCLFLALVELDRRDKANAGLDFASDDLQEVMAKLTEAGFVPYLTAIGGSGLGMLNSPERTEAIGGEFSSKACEELAQWVEGRQGWQYV